MFNVIMWSPPKYVDYEFPGWTHFVGWLMALSSMTCIPGYAIYKYITSPHPGTWKEVSGREMCWYLSLKLVFFQ